MQDASNPAPVENEVKSRLTSPPDGPRHGVGMVPGVRAGGFLFFSAIRGRGPGAKEYAPSAEAQARQALDNLRILIEEAGGRLSDVVKVTLYLGDLRDRQEFHQVWMEYFPDDPPARIALQVADPNASPGSGALFALDVIAVDRVNAQAAAQR